MSKPMHVDHIFASKVLAASANDTRNIDLERLNAEGYFSTQIIVTAGTGVLKCEYLLSNDGTNFVEPTGATDVFSSFSATSGPGSDGIDIYTFTPDLAKWIQIKMTETAGLASVTFDLYIAIQ
jgi:hypothetical protein